MSQMSASAQSHAILSQASMRTALPRSGEGETLRSVATRDESTRRPDSDERRKNKVVPAIIFRCSWRVIFTGIRTLLSLLVFGLGFVSDSSAMEMKLVGNQLFMSDGVVDSDYVKFKEMLRLHGDQFDTVVMQNSAGGDGWAGMTIGEMIRNKGLRTVVSGYCLSACSLIFMGGRERNFAEKIPKTVPRLGFHGTYKMSDLSRLSWGALYTRKDWIIQQTNGKVDEALLDRWQRIQNHRGFAYFYHPDQVTRTKGVSVFFCDGNQPKGESLFGRCENIPDKDAFSMGIVTSLDIVTLNKEDLGDLNTPKIEVTTVLDENRVVVEMKP